MSNKINRSAAFIDETFEDGQVSGCQMVFQLGMDGMLIAVKERAKNKYIAFEKYDFQNAYNFEVLEELLKQVKENSKLFNHRYGSVICLVVNNFSTLVPDPLFEEDEKRMYLKFTASLQGDEFLGADEIKSLDAKNVFAMPMNLKNYLDGLFPKISYRHFSSGLIDSLLAQSKNQNMKRVFLHIQASHFEAIVVEGKKLLFYNTFNYHSSEDVVYYLLFVCEQLQLNPENIEMVLLGEIEKNSSVYSLIQKYVRYLKFGERADGADYSYQLQTFPKHFYFTLFNNYVA